MEFGVMHYTTDLSLRPAAIAAELEERGYSSYFVPDHTHIPSSRTTPYPGGGDLATDYPRFLEPFCALTEAAMATTRLRLGTCVCLVAQRDPIVLAKQVATVDHLSGGRFVFGIGYGWNVEEMRNHGLDASKRRAVLREKVLAMKRLWADEEGEFHGHHVDIEPTWLWPKPVQSPHPPIWLGAVGPTAYAHVAEFADGWLPIAGSRISKRRPGLDEVLIASGRDPSTVPTVVIAPMPSVEAFEHYERSGVAMVILHPPSACTETLRALDRFDEVIANYRGATDR